MAVSTTKVKSIPKSKADRELRDAVAWGCRILHCFGHGDNTLGHVSARLPGAEAMLMKGKGIGLDEVTSANVVPIDFHGRRLAGQHPIHLELALHAEVYKIRPDVGGIVHTHPRFATALGATAQPLQVLSHDGILFEDGVALFDETPALITEEGQGAAIAAALGSRKALLIKNHGILTVGPTVPWAVFTAVTLERAAQIQSIAGTLGTPRPIPDQVVRAMYHSKYSDRWIAEYWEYFKRVVRGQGLAKGLTPR